jgi:hypothetical protein
MQTQETDDELFDFFNFTPTNLDLGNDNLFPDVSPIISQAPSPPVQKTPAVHHPKSRGRPLHNHHKVSIEILKAWCEKNISMPFPSQCIKERLAIESGLTFTQISTWFINHRKRCTTPLRAAEGLPKLHNRLGRCLDDKPYTTPLRAAEGLSKSHKRLRKCTPLITMFRYTQTTDEYADLAEHTRYLQTLLCPRNLHYSYLETLLSPENIV